MQRAEGFGQSPPYVIQGGPSAGDKGPGDRDDGLQGHRTSKQHYWGAWKQKTPLITNHRCDFNHGGRFFYDMCRRGSHFSLNYQPECLPLDTTNDFASIRNNQWEKCIYVCFLADFRLILQQFHSSRSTVSTFIPPVRITKDNFIKVKSRRLQQEGGCGVYWVFLCWTGSSPSSGWCLLSFWLHN